MIYRALLLNYDASTKKTNLQIGKNLKRINMDSEKTFKQSPIDISEADILEAMSAIDGYIDITPADFIEIYRVSYHHALNRLANKRTAKDVMSRPVIYTRINALLGDAAGTMAENNITGLPVMDVFSKVVGVLSEKDILREAGISVNQSFMAILSRCMNHSGCMISSLNTRKVGDIMTTPAITVNENTPLSEIAAIFNCQKINRVPVLDKNSDLCGIVTRSDIVQSFGLDNV